MNCKIKLSSIYIIAFLISISFKLCTAQEKPRDGLYLSPAFGYASYLHVVERPAPFSTTMDNYAKNRFTLNYLLGGVFGFDIGRRAALFVNFATIRCKREYWSKYPLYGGRSGDWSESKNEFGDVYYFSIFMRYRIKDRDKSSAYFIIGPTAFTDKTGGSSTDLFGPGILLGVGYAKKIFKCLSIKFKK